MDCEGEDDDDEEEGLLLPRHWGVGGGRLLIGAMGRPFTGLAVASCAEWL